MSTTLPRTRPRVNSPVNPYRENVQAKANEPITVAALLDRGKQMLGLPDVQWSLEEIYDRLEENAPRIGIVGGSPDHPAHILDLETALRAAHRVWELGGVPFYFSIPVLCDGTAQSTMGMSYSLASRNLTTAQVINQMEAQIYHGAFVIQGCDKQPMAIVAGLAHLDVIRQRRGEAPVFASFAPTHVLKGGVIPDHAKAALGEVARRCEEQGHPDLADDLRDTMGYILQCTSNTAFQGVLTRAREVGALTIDEHKELEKALAVNTCDAKGGICAFNGTGNSSRHLVAGLGLVHPAVELLTEPPTQEQVNAAIDAMFGFYNDPAYSVSSLVVKNIANATRLHSASGGSTNLMMHLVSAMVHAGHQFSIYDLERIRVAHPIPDLFDYSLTQGRDIFRLAQQCCSGQIRGMDTLMHELHRNGVPLDLDAPTVAGGTWAARLADTTNLSAEGVTVNPIILARPRRGFSGIDVLRGNVMETAVVKISGMPDAQLNDFDEKVAVVLYFENEDAANERLLDVHLLDHFRADAGLERAALLALHQFNRTASDPTLDDLAALDDESLFARMLAAKTLKVATVISGQGPEAFGMPEMFNPMQHINANRVLKKTSVLISDGRYSGVTYGAAIGHVTPEALNKGGILYLRTGDLIHLRFRANRLELLDPVALTERGEAALYPADLAVERADLGRERLARIRARQRMVAAPNRLEGCTDAAQGVVPLAVWRDADEVYADHAGSAGVTLPHPA
jgi:dihydroxyacid dehydratase/phosphogluconate dehydratase